MKRYSQILNKHPREIVLLKGRPCVWGRCAFCDYIDDNSSDETECNSINEEVLSHVTGRYRELEVINSGSVFELPTKTLNLIRDIVKEREIEKLSFESHWIYRHRLEEIRNFFSVPITFKCGIETFDDDFRNRVLKKGITFDTFHEVVRYFNSVCILVGVLGQTRKMIERDVDILLNNFEYGCINVFNENNTCVKRDDELVSWFRQEYGFVEALPNVDVLFDNTDFGVGGV